MASLKKRIILSFSASLGIFLFFVSIIIFSGLNLALKGWYKASEARYAFSVIKTLEKQYSKNTNPSDEDIIKAVEQHLDDKFSLLVISENGRIIVAHNMKKPPLPPPPFLETGRLKREENQQSGMGMGRRGMENMMSSGMRPEMMPEFFRSMTPVVVNGKNVSFVWVKAALFETADSLNRQLIRSVLFTLLLGITASVAAAIFSTSLISGKITKEASSVSKGLEKMASGSRNVVFQESRLTEISSISTSALILQEKLAKEEEARKQWTQDIAHDLRTPTTAIKAQLEAMIDGVLKPEKERLEKLLAETNRLENLVEDINRLTKIESPEAQLSYSEISSQELADIIRERFTMQAEEKKIKLEIESESFNLSCDINLIIRAVSNLVQNSIQYSKPGSPVNVKFFRENGCSVISVENPGSIPENEIERIFDRLFRGEYSRSSKGSGLGLTIAKAAVEKHNGRIIAENRIRGKEETVCFTVTIPSGKGN